MVVCGKSVFGGIAIGPIAVYDRGETTVKRENITDVKAELKRFEKAKSAAREQLRQLYQAARRDVGDDAAAIFDVHQMMLEDFEYIESITNMIETQKVNAEYAVAATGDNLSAMFLAMDDEYMSARAGDIRDVSNRVVSILLGKKSDTKNLEEPVILLSDDLNPSETVQLDKSKILSFVLRFGSANSHTAILARTMNIPAIIGVDYPKDIEGKLGIVDAYEGKLILDPTDEVLEEYKNKLEKEKETKKRLIQLIGKENKTKDGTQIDIYANIGGVADADSVIDNDAGGIGLFRSEFLYLESEHYPTEEEQFEAYKSVVERMSGKKVIIRTLDIGADKSVDYFDLAKEENPAMGYRAIRICLDRVEVFKTQLRALYRASAYGNVAIMFPMIISVDEVLKIKEISKQIKEELIAEGVKVGEVEEGIMIETPAAAIMSDELAKHVDFFSIGTNDLTQYTLAIDRQNAKLDPFYNAHHPALLRLIKMVAENGHKEGIWTGICGELGADTSLTEEFIKMGVDELSVSPGAVLQVRKTIRDCQ